MKDVMIDLETFGKSNNAVVVQIGACYFDRRTGEIGDEFLVNVDIDSSLKRGFEVDGSTLLWWLRQDKNAQKSITEGKKEDVASAFFEINKFLENSEFIWSHATFDFPILMNYLNKLGMEPTFSFRSARDLRTLLDLANINHKRVGTHHNALDDCLYQVNYAVDCMKVLEIT